MIACFPWQNFFTVTVHIPPPWRRSRRATIQATAMAGRVGAALSAGVDDAEAGGVEPATLVGSGSEADAPGDHGVAQRAFGLVVGRRQVRVGDERDDRVPVVEDFPRQIANLFFDVVP